MAMKLKIRKSQPGDARVLAELWHEMARFHARQGSYWRIKPKCKKGYVTYMQEVAKAKDKAVFIAEGDGRPVGFIMVQLSSRARIFVEREHGLVVDLAVTKAVRRSGIGQKLFERAVRWFKTQGVKTLEVRASTSNPLATAFWRKMGFDPYMVMNKRQI